MFENGIEFSLGYTDGNGNFHTIEPVPNHPPKWERCIFCEAKFDLTNLHPGHVKYFGENPKVCRMCSLCFKQYGKIWSADIECRITEVKQHAGEPRNCFMCYKEFNLLGSFYRHMWYKDEYQDTQFSDSNPEWGFWIEQDGIDFLYPNLYTEICPACFQSLFRQNINIDPHDQALAVRELGERIGKLPVKNFPIYIYSYSDRQNIEWFLTLLKRLPNPSLINGRFGSFFKLLLMSGLLPDGTRRMHLGTWTIAKDGDMCFSIVEREIDNWLFHNKIAHTKEVKYPNSDMRCDWEVIKGEERIFIEYFGLLNRKTYEEKAAIKKKLAKENGIKLISITPKDDWLSMLTDLFLK